MTRAGSPDGGHRISPDPALSGTPASEGGRLGVRVAVGQHGTADPVVPFSDLVEDKACDELLGAVEPDGAGVRCSDSGGVWRMRGEGRRGAVVRREMACGSQCPAAALGSPAGARRRESRGSSEAAEEFLGGGVSEAHGERLSPFRP